MNARLINLRTRRKSKARGDDKAEADRRAVEFGRSRAERELTRAKARIEKSRLDSHVLGPEDDR